MRREAINVMMGLFVVGMLCLTGCGGGGGGGGTETPQDTTPIPPVTTQDPTPTPTVTNVDLTTFKGLFTGTAAPGSEASFTLTGSDTSGIAYDGSFTMVSDGTTTDYNQSTTRSRVIVTLIKASGAPETSTLTEYFLTSNGNLYKQISSSGIEGNPNSQTPLPDSAKIGDSGHLWDVTNSNGTSDSCTWKLEADTDNNTKLILTFTNKNSSNVATGLEEDTFYLNSSGVPYKYSVTFTSNGQTLTMSGNRN